MSKKSADEISRIGLHFVAVDLGHARDMTYRFNLFLSVGIGSILGIMAQPNMSKSQADMNTQE